MSRSTLVTGIENQSKKDIRIADELANIVVFCCQNNYVQGEKAIKTQAITGRCAEATYSRLERLVDMGFLNKQKQGADTWIIHEPTGEFLGATEMAAKLRQEIRSLIRHIKNDNTVKQIAARELSVSPGNVVAEIQRGGDWERRQNLEIVVSAIEEDPRVTKGNYGKVIVRNPPNYYQATGRSVRLFKK